jgi:hypothetical protein
MLPAPTPAAPRRSRGWVWFFVMLTMMAAVAIIIPIVYNLSLQLTPEQLAQARRLWQEHGPRDYDLEYAEKLDPDTRIFIYAVKVRDGRAVSLVCNGKPELLDERAGLVVGPIALLGDAAEAQEHTVEGLFRQIEQSLREDAERGGRRNYVTATFDREDGHPLRYIRRVAGSRDRMEWNIKLHPIHRDPAP